MKLTLLKWKYQIIHKYDDFFYIYKIPYGIFSFLKMRDCKGAFSLLEDAQKECERLLAKPLIQTKIIKEYLI